jgi:hypothetical protein
MKIAQNHRCSGFIWLLLAGLIAGLAAGCAGTAETEPSAPATVHAKNLSPVTPQPDENALAPGLAVVYFRNFFLKTLEHLPTAGSDYAKQIGREGDPILEINHAFGKEEVFGSGEKQLIGMRMTGLIHFKQTGEYLLQALSNDGIRVYVDGQRVIDDGKWQKGGDRMSHESYLDIRTPGWYPLQVEYFQRKGTAAAKLFWRAPGGTDSAPVPAEAYAHRTASD